MLGTPPLAAEEEGILDFTPTCETDPTTSLRRQRGQRPDVVVAILDHLDKQTERVVTTLECFSWAALESVSIFTQGRKAPPAPPALESSADHRFEWCQDFGELSLELAACLLPISEGEVRFEGLFHDSSKLAAVERSADGFCPTG